VKADDTFSLAGKSAIVTGGLGILGKAFCRGLAAAGANVAVVDKADGAEGFAAEIAREYGTKTLGISCDLTEPASVQKVTNDCLKTFRRIDILHNNAAGKSNSLDEFLKPFEEYSLKTWQDVMSANVDTMFLMAQSVGKHMKDAGGGSIVQTSSIYGVVAPDKRIYGGSEFNGRPISSPAVYSASKAAVIGLTQYLAAYWGEFNIRVNTLTPGGVSSGQNDVFYQKYSARVPMGRMATSEDVVGALIYLASDASKYTTGQNIVIDGGLTVW
jgi:NAD(P)-dependent dehydrogenase (short-subunit alcohol dehydrogenase family)